MKDNLKFIIFDNTAEAIPEVGSGVFVFTLATNIDTIHHSLSGDFKIQTQMALDDHENRLALAGCDNPRLYRSSIEIPGYHSLQNQPSARFTYVKGFFDTNQAIEACPKAQCTVANNLNELRTLYDGFMLERKRGLVTAERLKTPQSCHTQSFTA